MNKKENFNYWIIFPNILRLATAQTDTSLPPSESWNLVSIFICEQPPQLYSHPKQLDQPKFVNQMISEDSITMIFIAKDHKHIFIDKVFNHFNAFFSSTNFQILNGILLVANKGLVLANFGKNMWIL